MSRLVGKGATQRDAEIMARAIHTPYTRCCICGVPGRILGLYHRRNIPVPSTILKRWRLEVDRIKPGGAYRLENTRILCPGCNSYRGPSYGELKSDGEVLANMRRRWNGTLDQKYLWWLNTLPGSGGLPFRGRKHPNDPEGENEVPSSD